MDGLPALLRIRRRGAAHVPALRTRPSIPAARFRPPRRRIVMLTRNERMAGLLPARAQRPELVADPRFASNGRAPRHAIPCAQSSSRPSAMSAEQVVARLDAAQIANARVNTMSESGRIRAARAVAGRPSRRLSGPVPRSPPGAHDASEVRMDPVPALGAHRRARSPSSATTGRRSRGCTPRARSERPLEETTIRESHPGAELAASPRRLRRSDRAGPRARRGPDDRLARLGCAGKGARPVGRSPLRRGDGRCRWTERVLIHRRGSSPLSPR